MLKSYSDAILAISLVFDDLKREHPYRLSESTANDVEEEFPLLARLIRSRTPTEEVDDDTSGLINTLEGAFSALKDVDPHPFGDRGPSFDAIVEANNLLEARDQEALNAVTRVFPQVRTILDEDIMGNYTRGFLVAMIVLVLWLDHNVPEDLTGEIGETAFALPEETAPVEKNEGSEDVEPIVPDDTPLPLEQEGAHFRDIVLACLDDQQEMTLYVERGVVVAAMQVEAPCSTTDLINIANKLKRLSRGDKEPTIGVDNDTAYVSITL